MVDPIDATMDKKKAAILGLSALGSMLVSYLVYKSVAGEDGELQDSRSRKRERMLRKTRQSRTQQQNSRTKIVGAVPSLQLRDELTQEEQERLKLERMESDLQNAATGTKTIYFDNNDNMYTEEEVLSQQISKKRHLTKMKVRVPEQDRKRLNDVQGRQTKECLNDFLYQIKSTKSNYVVERSGMPGGKARSSHPYRNKGLGSEMTTSSGTVRSLNRIKLEPRHFKSKEGTVWLNMFETISSNYCFGGDANSAGQNRMNPNHRYNNRGTYNSIKSGNKSRSSRRLGNRESSLGETQGAAMGGLQRESRASRFAQAQQQQRPKITRSTSLDMNMSNFE